MSTEHNRHSASTKDARKTFLVGSSFPADLDVHTCPSAGTLEAWSYTHNSWIVIAITCGRWGCTVCGTLKARRLAARTRDARPSKLITLTVNPACHETPRAAYDHTRRALAELSKRIRKRTPEFEYLRVLELTRQGWPHYHLVARCNFISQSWLSTNWADLSGAKIVDVRQIKKGRRVFNYVMKYLLKQKYIHWTNRRCSVSRNFFPKEDEANNRTWKLDSQRIHKIPPDVWMRSRHTHLLVTEINQHAWTIETPGEESNENLDC